MMADNFAVTLIGCLITVLSISCVSTQDVGLCATPKGEGGVCIDFRQCASLVALIQTNPLPDESVFYLQQSQCGSMNKTVLICCPARELKKRQAPSVASVSLKAALLPSPGKCGLMHLSNIVSDPQAEVDAFGWLALLEYSKGDNEVAHHCGGTLINDRYILTAAHCVSGLPQTWSLTRVRLGEWNRLQDPDCTDWRHNECVDPHVDVTIEKVIPHENFEITSTNRLHDIALIRLSRSVAFTPYVRPICLPLSEKLPPAADGQELILSGWGATADGVWSNIKQKVNAPVGPLSSCQTKAKILGMELKGSQMCVQGAAINSTCLVDSGGPAISFDRVGDKRDSVYIVGIHSFGLAPCQVADWQGVFTRVGDYVDWILQNIEP